MAPQSERQILERFRATPEGQAILRAIRYAEGTERPDTPYNVQFGGGRFTGYSRHPDQVISSGGYRSAAAGAYQFMPGTWAGRQQALGLSDFGPKNQDIAALSLARERLKPLGGLAALQREGLSARVANALAPEWASFPTLSGRSYYGQPVKSLSSIQARYTDPRFTTLGAGEEAQAQAEEATPFQLPRQSFSQQLYGKLVNTLASNPQAQSAAQNRAIEKSFELNDMADELEDSGDPELVEAADQLRAQAIAVPTVAQSSALGPDQILKTVFSTYKEVQDYNKGVSQYEDFVNQLNRSQLRQKAETLSGTGLNRGISITSASDATGEPGIDYVVEGGRRGANFFSPENATVVKVVSGQNAETRLESNPNGPRGYGNQVRLRMNRPDGTPVDVLFAHFDSVNPNLRPGTRISAGTLLGTQGRTGSTTGAHISADFFKPDTFTGDLTTRDLVRSRIPSGRFF